MLCLDIGNTNIVVGAFAKDELCAEFRLKTEPGRTIDEYVALVGTLLEKKLGVNWRPERAVICSVVPPLTQDAVVLCRQLFNIEPLVIGPGVRTGIKINVTEPTAVGADRIVNAVAARELYGAPAIVVDFGTATTFDLVSKDGAYEGGIIAPGAVISMEALVRNTAKLPKIELSWPKTVVGKNTVAAMQSGAVIGYCCMVDGLIEKVIAEVGPIDHIIATGGLGRIFTEHSKYLAKYEPRLTLLGMKMIARMQEAP